MLIQYLGQLFNINITMNKITCEILEISKQKIKFALNGCDVSLANALRRVLLSQVPTLAPHLVSIIQNSSVLHDEFLVQRIGLIPFISDAVDKFKYPWECDCSTESTDDCQVCKAYFIINKQNKDMDECEVTSLDIIPAYQGMFSEDDDIRPVKPVEFQSDLKKGVKLGVPIVKLARNQKVELRIEVQKGIGKMHAKWSPASLATFQPEPQIKINEGVELTQSEKIAIRDSCPTKVFEVQQDIFQVANAQKCIFCNECTKMADSLDVQKLKNFISIGKKKDRFLFTVESVGSLSAANIVKKSMAVLREKLKNLQSAII